MGKTYKAVEISTPGTFRLVERPVVAPGAGQVRIRVEACGVCHSDSFTVEGQMPGSFPRIPGHEIAGVIDAIGAGKGSSRFTGVHLVVRGGPQAEPPA